MNQSVVRVLALLMVAFFSTADAVAQESALQDRNGDGSIEVFAFGDSITFGIGDGIEPGIFVDHVGDQGKPLGWPARLSSLLGVGVLNGGVPGELVAPIAGDHRSGVDRFPGVIVGSDVDTVIIKEGANDAFHRAPVKTVERNLQKMINVARAENKTVVLTTLATPTLNRDWLAPFTTEYSAAIRELGKLNSLQVVDIEKAFLEECPDLTTCRYYNLPEGLHPNTAGYDAIAQVFADSLG